MKEEVWRQVKGNSDYEVSNHGRVKSLKRCSGKILKQINHPNGYLFVNIYESGIRRPTMVHVLVAESFLNHIRQGHKLVVDHIDSNKKNNLLENIQIISNRRNLTKDKKPKSGLTGAYHVKGTTKYTSYINTMGRLKYLGTFENKKLANIAYNKELNKIKKS